MNKRLCNIGNLGFNTTYSLKEASYALLCTFYCNFKKCFSESVAHLRNIYIFNFIQILKSNLTFRNSLIRNKKFPLGSLNLKLN